LNYFQNYNIMKLKILSLLFGILIVSQLHSQEINNVNLLKMGNNITVRYDLQCKKGFSCTVKASLYKENDYYPIEFFGGKTKNDIGKGVKGGTGKYFTWEVPSDVFAETPKCKLEIEEVYPSRFYQIGFTAIGGRIGISTLLKVFPYKILSLHLQ